MELEHVTMTDAQQLANLIEEKVYLLSNGELVAADSDLAREYLAAGVWVVEIAEAK